MAELKIRRGSFLIQVHDKGDVAYAIRVPDVKFNDLKKIVIEVDDVVAVGPHPEIVIDIRKGNTKHKKQKIKWHGPGKKYEAGAPGPP